MSPVEAIDLFQAIHAKRLMPIHFDTFLLAPETTMPDVAPEDLEFGIPLKQLKNEAQKRRILDRIVCKDVGDDARFATKTVKRSGR